METVLPIVGALLGLLGLVIWIDSWLKIRATAESTAALVRQLAGVLPVIPEDLDLREAALCLRAAHARAVGQTFAEDTLDAVDTERKERRTRHARAAAEQRYGDTIGRHE